MTEKYLLALMYDFYNKHTLKGQNNDINYYINQIKKYNAKEVLVVGAGTGRVAIPLFKYASITALDFDEERLKLLNGKEKNIVTVCTNFLDYKTTKVFDLIIIPYSTLQFDNNEEKLNLFFKSLYNLISEETIIIFDVSESFNLKEEKNSELLFKKYCSEIDDNVEVYYSSKHYKNYIEFLIEYKLHDKNISVLEKERYYYYNKNILLDLIEKNNFKLLKIDDGYGNDDFKHKHLYHIRRLK